jgi:iron complex transport system permease protein
MIALSTTIQSLLAYDGSTEHRIIWELRTERTTLGLFIGFAMGVAGAVMQSVTRNPIADPGLLGINAGASLGVVIAISVFSLSSYQEFVWFAVGGAGVVSLGVSLLGGIGNGGVTPIRLALAGAAVNALLYALVRFLLLVDGNTLDTFRFWGAGSLAGSDAGLLLVLWPFLLVGAVIALVIGRALNALALGEDMARSLGINTGTVQVAALLTIAMLTGASVAAVGPVGFIGLVVPHLARAWCGPDNQWLILYSGLLGALFLLACDVLGRILLAPAEIEVGILTAAVGGIAFMFIVRRVRMVQL